MFADLWTFVQEQLAQNELLAGGVGVASFSYAMYAARSLPARIWHVLERQFTIRLEVPNDTEAFTWITEWLQRQEYSRRCRRLRLNSVHGGDGHPERWQLSPGLGNHVFWYRGRPVICYREEAEQSGNSLTRRETIGFRTVGRDARILRHVVEEARAIMDRRDRVEVRTWLDCYWGRVGDKNPRALESVVLPDSVVERVVRHVGWFLGAREWYAQRGVPYYTGILLSGPPGCGKTSLALALASHFGCCLHVLNLGAVKDDNELSSAFRDVREGGIVLLEDVDTVEVARDRREDRQGGGERLTLSGLLNGIDGATAAEGRVLIMTTSYPDRLDAALVRSGRADVHLDIGPLRGPEVARLHERFFGPHEAQGHLLDWPGALPAAEAQGIFMESRDEPAVAAGKVMEAMRR